MSIKATIMLVGKSGCGKSMLANMLFDLKDETSEFYFPVEEALGSRVSVEPQAFAKKFDGLTLRVIDTPGFFDTEFKVQERWIDLLKAVNLAGRELDIIVLVVNALELPAGAKCMELVQENMMDFLHNNLIIVFTHLKTTDEMKCEQCLNDFNKLLKRGTLGATFIFSDQKSDESIINQKRIEIINCVKKMKTKAVKPLEKKNFSNYTEHVLKEKIKELPGSKVTLDDLCSLLKVPVDVIIPYVSRRRIEEMIASHNQQMQIQRQSKTDSKSGSCILQ